MKNKLIAILAIALISSLLMITVPILPVNASPNSVESSTMHFEGTLTDEGGGVYTGTIPMTAGEYYVPGGPGESIWDQGGFDVYAKEGGTAYVEGMDPETWTIGPDHDAYSESGPWGTWYDPDCADWDKYELELTEDHWYLRYAPTGESPMSGIMYWYGDGTGYAAETDPGTVNTAHGGSGTDPTEYSAGSAQEWGWWCGWGQERIPLEYPGFRVEVTGGSSYHVTMTPAPVTAELYIDPAVINKNPGDSDFTVDVTIENFESLMGFDIKLTWDSTLISFVSVDKTPLNSLWPGGWTVGYEDQGAGYYRLAAVSTSTSASSTGAMDLFTLTFNIEKSCNFQLETPIHFALVKLSDDTEPVPNPINAIVTDGMYYMSATTPDLEFAPPYKTWTTTAHQSGGTDGFDVTISFSMSEDSFTWTFDADMEDPDAQSNLNTVGNSVNLQLDGDDSDNWFYVLYTDGSYIKVEYWTWNWLEQGNIADLGASVNAETDGHVVWTIPNSLAADGTVKMMGSQPFGYGFLPPEGTVFAGEGYSPWGPFEYSDYFTVEVYVTDICSDSPLTDYDLTITFDHTLVKFIQVDYWGIFGTGSCESLGDNMIHVWGADGPWFGDEGLLFALRFHVEFECTVEHIWRVCMQNFEEFKIEIVDATLSFTEGREILMDGIDMPDPLDITINFIRGDVNCDGKVTIDDISTAAYHYETTEEMYDLNCDGIVDIYDLVAIATNYGYGT